MHIEKVGLERPLVDKEGTADVTDSDVIAERDMVLSGNIPQNTEILIKKLRKEYHMGIGQPTKVAVQNVCLAIPRGECFGLLGPNGSGKTTTISCLTGLYKPTSGSATIHGLDLDTQLSEIHQVLGVCPQFDTMWKNLTCKEHMEFYARVKGHPEENLTSHVLELLGEVGLADVHGRFAGDLSGGMRRRLSVALSLVGNPAIVFLDEPTTGLDPASRKQLWNILQKFKEGRCMILTTHSMEEADELCNRIGVFSNGSFKCLGTPLHLKNKFGEGYRLTINYREGAEQSAMGLVKSLLPAASPLTSFPGTVTFQIPRSGVVISTVFHEMETHKDSAGILDWGLSQTSLEDVFMNLVRDAKSGHGPEVVVAK
jgi:ABC-type multidrug transport system ATPase subunit